MAASPKIEKAQKLFDKETKRMGLGYQARRWLEMACDPFHDTPISPEGFPDSIMAPSVVQIVRNQGVIATVSGTSTWDCSVFMDIVPTTQALTLTTPMADGVWARVGQTGASARGGLVYRQDLAGLPLDSGVASTSLGLDPQYYTNTDTRVVACGFEIHNVTNKLTVAGSATVWRLPRTVDNGTKIATIVESGDGNTACISSSQPFVVLPTPPETAGEANNMPNSMTWEAVKGAYLVPCMVETDNWPEDYDVKFFGTVDNDGTWWASPITATGTAKQMTVGTQGAATPFGLSGVFFAGLPPDTKLVVNTVYVLERFPGPQNADLITLARPSTPYDFKALRLYSEMTRTMSSGVPVNANGFGDWFASQAANILRLAPTMLGVATRSGGLGGILGDARNNPQMNNALSLYNPNKFSGNKAMTVQSTSPIGWLAEKAYDYGKEIITRKFTSEPASKNQKNVKKSNTTTQEVIVRPLTRMAPVSKRNGGGYIPYGYQNVSNVSGGRMTGTWNNVNNNRAQRRRK